MVNITDPPEVCPCGGVATLRIAGEDATTGNPLFAYVCRQCGATSIPNPTGAGAANAWHRGERIGQ